MGGGCWVLAEPDRESDNSLTLADYELGLTYETKKGIRTKKTSKSTDDLPVHRYGKRLRAGSNSTDIAAEDRKSHPACTGNLSLSDIDNRF